MRLLTDLSRVTCAARGEGLRDLLGVAVVEVERDIARRLVVELRRARLRPPARGVGHGGQRLDVELDRLGRVLGLRHGLGDDAGHRSPTKRTLSVASAGRGGVFIGVPSRFVNGMRALQRADSRRGEVGAGVDAEHARHLARRVGVDALG